MKRYTDYTKEELTAIDNARVNRLINIELAFKGIAPVPKPEPYFLREAFTVSFYNKEGAFVHTHCSKNKKEKYDKEDEAYESYIEKISAIRDEVWSAVAEARRHARAVKVAINTLKHYKDLADGDEKIAENFFRNAYRDRPEIIEEVLGEKVKEAKQSCLAF